MPDWVIWAILSVLFAVGELFTPGLFFLGPIALAALAATVVAALGGGLLAQIIVFGVGSFAAVGLLRPLARKHLTMPRSKARRRSSSSAWTAAAGASRSGERSGALAPTCPTRSSTSAPKSRSSRSRAPQPWSTDRDKRR